MSEKPDAQAFRDRLSRLKHESWLGSRRWWPYFLFHHTDITNVVRILASDTLLSRNLAQHLNFTDSASPEIIGQTRERFKNFVRFYFRPRTPTFYHAEGFRPSHRLRYHARCPVPIYLLFNLEKVICRSDAQFSQGNLARTRARIYSQAADFEQMPFQQIYHDSGLGGFDERQRDNVIFHRHAEVIIPDKIDLQNLQLVWCRSEAEYEMLHYLLGDSLWEKWKEKITQRTDQSLFHRLWVYVDSVILGSKEIRFRFHPCNNSSDQGPFHLRVEIREKFTGLVYTWEKMGFVFDTNYLVLNLVNLEHPEWYVVTLTIDGHIAYANEYSEFEDIPF